MNFYRWFITILVILVTILGLGFVKYQQVQAAIAMAESFPEPSAAVKTTVTEVSEFTPVTRVTGQAVATKVIELQNELPGVIDVVNFTGGSSVSAGQLLLAQNTVEEKAQLDAAVATLKQSQNNFTRMKKLVASDKVSQQEFDAADAQFKVAKANVANLKSIIAKKQIHAPFSGRLGLETYQVGEFLPANSSITTLVDDGPAIWVDFKLPQTHRTLQVGEEVRVRAITNLETMTWHSAQIIAINSQINNQSRHLTYRAVLPQGGEWLQHNEMVKITVAAKSQEVVKVPGAAVIRNKAGALVYQLAKDEKGMYRAVALPVSLGTRVGDEQIVLDGLVPGTLIATEGAFKLRQGLLVYPSANTANAQGIGS